MKTLKQTLKTIRPRINSCSGTARIRGTTGQVIRARIMKRDGYICRGCLPDRVSRAVVVDHIVPLADGGAEHDGNRQALCQACHDIKTENERVLRLSP